MSFTKTYLMALALGFAALAGSSAYAGDDAKGKEKDKKDMKADEAEAAGLCPVCKNESKPVYHFEYKGKDFHFKTRQCQKEFAADPTKFGAVGADWKPEGAKPDEKKTDDKKKPK